MLGENQSMHIVVLSGKQWPWKQGQRTCSLILGMKAIGLDGAIQTHPCAEPRASQRGVRTAKGPAFVRGALRADLALRECVYPDQKAGQMLALFVHDNKCWSSVS